MDRQPRGRERPFLAGRLAHSPELRERVKAATRLGISLRRFDGWEPVEVTTFAYDEQGRLTGSSSVRDVEWDDEQQAHVLALQMYEALTCAGCGGYLPETTAAEADEGYRADMPIRCHRCTAIGHQADAYRDAKQAHALRFPAHRRTTGGGGAA